MSVDWVPHDLPASDWRFQVLIRGRLVLVVVDVFDSSWSEGVADGDEPPLVAGSLHVAPDNRIFISFR